MQLNQLQQRFQNSIHKEYWIKLRKLLTSGNKESVIQGMSLIEQLDEEVYYDGVCTLLEDDGNGNWKLKNDLEWRNSFPLKIAILRLAYDCTEHELGKAFETGRFDRTLFQLFENINIEETEEYEREVLLSKVVKMVEIQGEDKSYFIMTYPVTQVLWYQMMKDTPSRYKGISRPVEMVSWFDCVIFANKLSEREGLEKVYELPMGMEQACKNQKYSYDNGIDVYAKKIMVNPLANGYRLPTEAEWEYAARGGEDYIYAGSNNLNDVGWYKENSEKKTHGVGLKKPNAYGLYDMSGNVYEWCFEAYDRSCHIFRGGAWRCLDKYCTVEFQNQYFPSNRNYYVGVRLCRGVFHTKDVNEVVEL